MREAGIRKSLMAITPLMSKASGHGTPIRPWAVGIGWFLCATGCMTPTQVPVAQNPSAASTASLEGFVTMVDDSYTSGDERPRALSPGCHIVTTTADPPRMTSAHMGTPRPIPVVHFPIDAKAGHRYVIQRKTELVDGRWKRVLVSLEEITPSGATVQRGTGIAANERPTSCVGAHG
jgi:hypothetical protein